MDASYKTPFPSRMWGSTITREEVLQKIILLAMLGGVREGSKEHELIPRPGRVSCLTIEQEREIVSNLAFLASRRKNSKAVVAIAIEEDDDGQGMTIRIAVNGDNVQHLKEGLIQISKTLEEVSRLEQSEIHDIESLLRQVVILDFSRICTRLRLGRKYRIKASPIMLLHQTLHDTSITGIEELKMIALREKATTLVEACRKLERVPQPSAYKTLEDVTRLAYNLNQSPEFSAALNKSSEFVSPQLASLGDSVAKLGQYYKAALELVQAARRKKCRLFRKIRVESFQIGVPESVRIPSEPRSLSLVNHLLETPKLLHRFQGSKAAVDVALVSRLNSERAAIKLHAEIKLLFYYETHPEHIRPRIICTNKSACYLCDLFFRIHGQFQLPRTYGKLNERWILPDWLQDIPPNRISALRNAVEQFSMVLDSQIKLASKDMKRQPDPMESSVGISAHWSNSTIDDGTWPQSILSSNIALTSPVRKGLGQSYSEYPPTPESLEHIPIPSQSSSCTVLVPAPSVSLTSMSNVFREHETLWPGKHIRRRLAEGDQSFTVTFYDVYAAIAFDVAQSPINQKDSIVWVQVGLVDSTGQPKLRNDGENVISVGDLQEGAEVAAAHGLESSQMALYVHWKGQIISIQCMSQL